jgi:hypothetical protein
VAALGPVTRSRSAHLPKRQSGLTSEFGRVQVFPRRLWPPSRGPSFMFGFKHYSLTVLSSSNEPEREMRLHHHPTCHHL